MDHETGWKIPSPVQGSQKGLFLLRGIITIIIILLQICDNPILACEVTLQPIEQYGFDASIIFSDILVIPKALGMCVEMQDGKGPVFPNPLVNPSDLELLKPLSVSSPPSCLDYVYDAVWLTRTALQGRAPLMAFCGTPWTLMTYMIEGGSSKLFSKCKKWLYAYP